MIWMFGGMFAMSDASGCSLTGVGPQRRGAHRRHRRGPPRLPALPRHSARRGCARSPPRQRAARGDRAPRAGRRGPRCCAAGRLWERRPADDDFGHVRDGSGCAAARHAARRAADGPGRGRRADHRARRCGGSCWPLRGARPAGGARRWARAPRSGWSRSAQLRGPAARPRAGPGGGRPQYALWHGPDEAAAGRRRTARAAPRRGSGRSGCRTWRTPAAATRRARCGCSPAHADEVRRWWVAGARRASRGSGRRAIRTCSSSSTGWPTGPARGPAVAGVTVLRVGAPPGRRPAPSVVRLLVGDGLRWQRAGGHSTADPDEDRTPASAWSARPDALTVPEARVPGPAAGPLPARRPGDLRRRPPGRRRCRACSASTPGRAASRRCGTAGAAPTTDRLRVPIGLDEQRRPACALDLKESALGGSGPHGLCIGATGSGKSELLRTLVLGLAASHSPDRAEPGARRLQGRRDLPRSSRRCRTSRRSSPTSPTS